MFVPKRSLFLLHHSKRFYGGSLSPSPLPWKHKATPYALLGVQKNATPKEIKTKYYELSFAHHPDRTIDLPEEAKIESNQKYVTIQQAYELLKDDKYRREYDQFGSFYTPSPNRSSDTRAYGSAKWDWSVQDPGTQPAGEFKIFRPWMYTVGALCFSMFFMTRSVFHRKSEMEEQAWKDWADAKKREGVYFDGPASRR